MTFKLCKAALLGLSVAVAPLAVSAQTLKWTSQGDALTLDPHSQNEGPTLAMNGQIYERLVNRNPDLTLVPELALSWTAVEPTKWEFKLREGVTFHGGEAHDSAHHNRWSQSDPSKPVDLDFYYRSGLGRGQRRG